MPELGVQQFSRGDKRQRDDATRQKVSLHAKMQKKFGPWSQNGVLNKFSPSVTGVSTCRNSRRVCLLNTVSPKTKSLIL